jgi:sporulation protein YlmC with PRC-barrel domain
MRLLIILSAIALAMPLGFAKAEEASAPPATMSNNLKVKFIDQQTTDRLGSKLIGASITNKADTSIGSIADIVFDEKNTIRAFVVSVGGLLGVGSKYVAVDPSVVIITTDKDKTKVMIDTDKDQLKAAPEYRYLSEQKTDK